MAFNNIIGQESIKEALKESIEKKRIAHAYLFEGPTGIGKKIIASEFAKMLLCSDLTDAIEPCNKCNNCVMYQVANHPDNHVFMTDKDSIKIEDVRDLFKDIHMTPYFSKHKVYVIDKAEKMTVQAQNCLLKTLEEPALDSFIILLTTNADSLIETIRSRTIKYNFKRYTKDEISMAINRYSETNGQKLSPEFIFNFSDGIIGRALDINKEGEFNDLREIAFGILNKIEATSPIDCINGVNELIQYKKNIIFLVEVFISYYRDLLVLSTSRDIQLLINSDKKDIILKGVKKISLKGIINSLRILNETIYALNRNANESLLMERLVMELREEYI